MDRLRAVLERRPVTEAELRKLTEEGRAWALLVNAQLEKSKRRLDELADDPEAPLSKVADALREVRELRPELDELDGLLAELQGRAREFRQSWVSRSLYEGVE
jgi:chromosome segregation ATPase